MCYFFLSKIFISANSNVKLFLEENQGIREKKWINGRLYTLRKKMR